MTSWDSQSFVAGAAAANRDPATISAALTHAAAIRAVSPDLPVLFTLNHLAQASGVSHQYLLDAAGRAIDPYRDFIVKKRAGSVEPAPSRRYRTICVPEPELMKVQRWIQKLILSVAIPHSASSAYSSGDSVYAAARRHCNARWLIKVDIQSFFESIKEPYVYSIFERLGYPDLLSFELARLCTRLPSFKSRKDIFKRQSVPAGGVLQNNWIGFLPQGAPTSPQLANLAMWRFDKRVTSTAKAAGLRYSRYSDDLIFSTAGPYSRLQAEQLVHELYDHLGAHGFEANRAKTVISAPGARKIVLGLLVDRDEPRLTRDFRATVELHLHFLERADIGPVAHTRNRGFESVIGLQNHLFGLIAFARQVNRSYGDALLRRARSIAWPV